MTPEEKLKLYAERVHLMDEDVVYLSNLLREAYERAAQAIERFQAEYKGYSLTVRECAVVIRRLAHSSSVEETLLSAEKFLSSQTPTSK